MPTVLPLANNLDTADQKPKSLLEQLRTDARLHAGILLAMQRGIAASDANVLMHAPVLVPNLLRYIFMNNELGIFFEEQGFKVSYKGAQTSFVKYCDLETMSNTFLLMRGYKQNYNGIDVFEVNPKTENLALRVAENCIDANPTDTLFPMDELIEKKIIQFDGYPSTIGNRVVILFWDPGNHHDVLEEENVNVYLAQPVAIDGNKSLIQCEWVEPVGAFNPASPASVNITPTYLPTAPAYEPSITPRLEGNDASIQ